MSQIQVSLKGSNLDKILQMVDYYVGSEEQKQLEGSLFDISKIPQKKHSDRALFVSLGFLAAGGEHLQYIKPFLIAAELLDESILIDDDAIDKSAERLGKPTVFSEYGLEYALLMSNDVLHNALRMFIDAALTAQKPAVITPFLEMSRKINEGQYLDMKYAGRPPQQITMDQYTELVRLTTGVHIGDSLMIGAMLAGSGNGNLFRLMNIIGENLGIAGQIYDDTIDWFPEINGTKGCFSDYLGKKARVPYLIGACNPETKDAVIEGFTRDVNPLILRQKLFSPKNYRDINDLFEKYVSMVKENLVELNTANTVTQIMNELLSTYATELAKVQKLVRTD